MYPPSLSLTLAHERQDYMRSGGRSLRTGAPAGRTPLGSMLRRVFRSRSRTQPETQARPVLVSGGP